MTIDIGQVSAAGVSLVFTILWTFAMEYLPWFKDWFDTKEEKYKKTINAAGIFIVVAGIYLLSLFDVMDGFPPNLQGLVEAFAVFFTVLGIGQGIHAGTKKTREVYQPARGRVNPD
jgi:hypothetical protein